MNFTLVIQIKGLVIRVIADNNPGLHSGVLDLSLPLPSHPPVFTAVAINREGL